MTALTTLVRSTIGRKVVMGFTGLVMVGWLTIHTLGNLLVFSGQDAFNHYAAFIQSGFGVEPALLWFLRAFMLGAIASHVWAAIGLTARNRAARPEAYAAGRKDRVTNYAARFMLIGGIMVLLFLLFHLAHLTVGVFSADAIQARKFVHGDAYRNLVVGLKNPVVAIFYILANMALAAHLRHGVTSGLQTLGLDHPRYNSLKTQLGVVVPLFIAGGNVIIALSILAGFVPPIDPKWSVPH